MISLHRIGRRSLAVLLVLIACSAGAGGETRNFDRWYSVLLQDQPAGWMHSTVRYEADRIVTDNQMEIAIRRGPITLKIEQGDRFIETLDHKPIEAQSRQILGATQVKQTYRFTPDAIVVRSEQGGNVQERKLPAPAEPWLTPEAASKLVRDKLNAGDKEIRYRTVNPALGPSPVEMVSRVQGPAKVEVMGKVVPAIMWDSSVSTAPQVVVREYVDESGHVVRATSESLPGMRMDIVAADEQLARAQVKAPEILVQTLIRPTGKVENPRQLRRAVYEVQLLAEKPASRANPAASSPEKVALEVPTVGYQRATKTSPTSTRVEVDLDRPVAAGAEDQPGEAHRRATTMLNSEDPQIVKLVEQALGEVKAGATAAQKAERLRQFVRTYIQEKDLGVGFATASEVARTAQGDCSEHAVLLAAMLRAAGMPSRTVTGVVFAEQFLGQAGVFGYHMWTQAWIEEKTGGRWVDLDAAIGDQAFDATHIALGTSALAEDAVVNDMLASMPLIGRLAIRVVEAEKTGNNGD